MSLISVINGGGAAVMADGTLVEKGTIANPGTKTEPVVFYARSRWETILKSRGKQGMPIGHQRGASAAKMHKTGLSLVSFVSGRRQY